ncbi:hypothetical protein TNIN_357761 [Trichonephila inaurata madagascariensis]|uniref:Uncharacterized protein n=1 Tax=Trichonephila inaurata madagascariensis TaxID=2747483 RepID=A0A8X6MKP3_9ARAC|nr:hypothetical protein TNIN_357761 [Trichonephila inaurata madagascariensis]
MFENSIPERRLQLNIEYLISRTCQSQGSAYFCQRYSEISSPCSTCLHSSYWLASWYAPWQCIPTDMSLDIPTGMIIWDITTWTMISTMSTIMTSITTSRNKDNEC